MGDASTIRVFGLDAEVVELQTGPGQLPVPLEDRLADGSGGAQRNPEQKCHQQCA